MAETAEEAEMAAELDEEKQLENDLAEAEGSKLIEDELRLSSTDEETESERGELARQPDDLPQAAVEVRPAAVEALHAEAERVRATSLLAGSPTVLKILRYTVPAQYSICKILNGTM